MNYSCKLCEKPINKNQYNSKKYNGICHKCYTLNTSRHKIRKYDKQIQKEQNFIEYDLN